MRWSKFFITRYRISILVLIAILFAGIWGITNNQRQDFPTIPLNFVVVTATFPGASPADVEREVIIPIEQSANTLDEVDYVKSRSQNGFGLVEVFVKDVNDTDKVATKLNNELNKIGLPNDADVEIKTVDATGPSIALGIIGNNGQSTSELIQYAGEIKTRLELSSPDLKRIEISPSNEFEIKITLDNSQLAAKNLSYDSIKSTIQSQVLSLPGGTVETSDGRKESITVNSPVQNLEDLNDLIIGRVKLSDIAEIERVPKNIDSVQYVGYVKDGTPFSKESVYLLIFKNDDGDIINMSDDIHAEIENIKNSGIIPNDIDIVTGFDLAPFIDDQINSLLNNGYLGLILILVVLLFFINLRTAIVVALVIPIVLLIGLFAMALLNFTINTLTLFAMILTLGILVDNAIVIAEGMVHELERGANKKTAALLSIKKFGPAVTAATLTTIVVFIPFANIGGIIGDFLKFIPYTVMILIAASYLVAISITPLMGRWILKEQTYQERRDTKLKRWQKLLVLPAIVHFGQNLIDRLANAYRSFMQRVYQRTQYKVIILLIVTILFGISFGYFAPRLEFEQFPSNDGDTMTINITFPAGTTYDEKKDVFVKVQDEAIKLPHFQNFYTFGDTIFSSFTQPKLREDKKTIYDIADEYKVGLNKIRSEISDDIEISAQAASAGPPTDQFALVVNFLDNDRGSLMEATADLEKFLASDGDIKNIVNSSEESLVNSIEVNLNQEKLAKRNVNSLAAAGTVNAIFAPQKIGSLTSGEDGLSDDLILSFSLESTNSIDDLNNLTVTSATGRQIKLSDIAEIESVRSPISIKRLDNRRVASLSIELEEDADPIALDQKVRDYLSEEKLVELGLSKDAVTFGGEFSVFETDFSKLQIVFVLAMLGVYLILVWQFYSYMQPLLIMFAIPLALIGVFPGLLFVGSTLNMISGLGVIALVGVVVNDAIVLISTFNRYRIEYPDEIISETLVRTGHSRFKPIFSTSITTIGGILPLTLLDPFWTGLGTSIIAGLIFSTIGTLVAIPILYSISISLRTYIKNKFSSSKT
ncbi:efflux RND transporter permease subunit [Patescibacteria group bacterium]|nr:efflux RND transporter permease subunit [Patescibacteria group bacterium]